MTAGPIAAAVAEATERGVVTFGVLSELFPDADQLAALRAFHHLAGSARRIVMDLDTIEAYEMAEHVLGRCVQAGVLTESDLDEYPYLWESIEYFLQGAGVLVVPSIDGAEAIVTVITEVVRSCGKHAAWTCAMEIRTGHASHLRTHAQTLKLFPTTALPGARFDSDLLEEIIRLCVLAESHDAETIGHRRRQSPATGPPPDPNTQPAAANAPNFPEGTQTSAPALRSLTSDFGAMAIGVAA